MVADEGHDEHRDYGEDRRHPCAQAERQAEPPEKHRMESQFATLSRSGGRYGRPCRSFGSCAVPPWSCSVSWPIGSTEAAGKEREEHAMPSVVVAGLALLISDIECISVEGDDGTSRCGEG